MAAEGSEQQSATEQDTWYIDSGTMSHICPKHDAFMTFNPSNTSIQGVGTAAAEAHGMGKVLICCHVGKEIITHVLHNVLYVPEAPNCLLSASRLDEARGSVTIGQGVCGR